MSKKIAFFPDTINLKYPGYLNILRPIIKRSSNYKIITTIDELDDDSEMVPFGVLKSSEYAGKGYKTAYLIDSVSLGFRSVILFYLKRHKFFNLELWLNILRYAKYAPIEKKIVNGYSTVIVASNHDASYLNARYATNKVVALPNGVDFPMKSEDVNSKINETYFSFKIGMLNYWGAGKPHDFSWFIEDILPALKKRYPAIRIILAGRGGSPELEKYFQLNGCEFIGEVASLEEYFSSVDIFITSMRKECGILNKALDAFAYKKIVVGFEPNMKAFCDLHNGYLTYKNSDQFVKCIEFIKNNPSDVIEMQNNAFEYVLNNNNWDKKISDLNMIFKSSLV